MESPVSCIYVQHTYVKGMLNELLCSSLRNRLGLETQGTRDTDYRQEVKADGIFNILKELESITYFRGC